MRTKNLLFAWLVSVASSPLACAPPASPTRSAVLIIADGLGPAATAYGMYWAREMEGRPSTLETLIESGQTGVTLLTTDDSIVVDSAASASQLASGVTVRSETLGVDPDGRSVASILEWAEERGMATGLVTTTRLSHATPAAFAAHQVSRYVDEADIVDDLMSAPEIEVLLGGGARAFGPDGRSVSELLPGVAPELDGVCTRDDGRNRVEEASEHGYAVVSDKKSLEKAAATSDKILGLFASSHLPYVIDRRNEALAGVPALEDMTRAALSALSRGKKGFFLVVEAGRIDHAAHDNDAGTMLQEILELDRAVEEVLLFHRLHPETLMVLTADHGTGGFSFSYRQRPEPMDVVLPSGQTYSRRWYYPGRAELALLGSQKMSFAKILESAGSNRERLIEVVERATGLSLTRQEAEQVLTRNEAGNAETRDFAEFYADYESTPMCLLGRALARQTCVVWSTGGHTSDPVLTVGIGPEADKLRGVYLNTHIYEVMKGALGGGE